MDSNDELEGWADLTKNQKEAALQNLIVRRSMAIDTLNSVVRSLAYRGQNTCLALHNQDDSKRTRDIGTPGSLVDISGPTYQQIVDCTHLPIPDATSQDGQEI